MIKIAHVSDLHFHKKAEDNEKALSLLDRIKGAYDFAHDEAYLLATGDIVDDGEISQYNNALTALKPFEEHLLVAPGNHDYGFGGNIFSHDSALLFDNEFLPNLGINFRFMQKQPMVRLLDDGAGTKLLTVGLNSVLETSTVLDFARGGIGKQQLSDLNTILSNPGYADIPKFVYLHHRPQKCIWFLEMVDAEDFMAVMNQNNVSVVAFGHSGGTMRPEEPPQARIMNIIKKEYGVKYLLNANSSVDAQKYYEIVVDNGEVSVSIK
jgi:3',5'-cyclic AMP phosphodiesterase CpdA